MNERTSDLYRVMIPSMLEKSLEVLLMKSMILLAFDWMKSTCVVNESLESKKKLKSFKVYTL